MQHFDTPTGGNPGGLTVLLCSGTDTRKTLDGKPNPTYGQEHTASKRYSKNGHGFKKVSDYNMGWQFDALPFQAESLPDIADLIGDLRSKPQAVIVRGELDAAYHVAKQADPDYLIRRRKRDKGDGVPAHLTEADRQYGMWDIDGYPLHPDDDLVNHPERVIQRCIEDLLPSDMHDATFFWQLSSSCGLVEGILKVHLWHWYDQPYANAHVRRWIKVVAPHIDHAPFNANQPHYIADPIVEGADDPLPARTGWLRREQMKTVALTGITEEAVRERHERRREKLETGGWPGTSILYAASIDDAIGFMGDGEDLDGFHRPLLAAGMAYARLCAKGFPRNDRDFKAKLREAIKAAPKREDRGEDGVAKYLGADYLDSQIAGAFALVENERRLNGIPSVPLPKRFGWAEHGLWYCPPAKKTDKDDPEPTVTPIWVSGYWDVIGRCRDADGGQHGLALRWTDEDGVAHTWIIPRRMFHEAVNAIAALLEDGGLRVNFAAERELRACLAKLVTNKALVAVERTGWHGESFVLTDGTVYGDDESIIMRPEYTRISDSCATRGTLEDWQQNIGRYCVGNSRLTFYVTAAFAGPLLEIVSEPSGGFHLHGPSSSGKSTAVYCAASVKGRGKHGAALMQWSATGNGLEAMAELNCDGFLALDEISQADAREAGDSIYRLANESGKTRMSKDITLRQSKTWRVLFISTGEVTLAQRMSDAGKRSMTGMEVRMANIPSNAGAGHGLFEDLHGFDHAGKLADHLRTAAGQYYGTPLRAFLDRLVELRREDADGLYRVIKDSRAKFVAEVVPPGADGQVSRVAGRFGVVAAAGELAIAFGILPAADGDATKAAARCFADWLTARGTIGSGEQESAVRQVRHFIELHSASRFQEIHPALTQREFTLMTPMQKVQTRLGGSHISEDDEDAHLNERWITNMAGYKKTDKGGSVTYMISPEVWKQEVCRGMDADAVARALHERGMLVKGQGHLTKLVRIPGQTNGRRFFVVSDRVLAADDADAEEAV